jgi:general stress protein 26
MATQPPPEPLTELKLVDEIKKAVNESFTSGKPVIVAYVDENGQPSLSFRGSTQAYSDTALSIWARNPDGGLLKSLQKNPRVTILYRDPETRAMLQFRGVARVDNSESAREHVYTNMPEPERNADREKKGSPVIIDLERVDGFMPGIRVAMRK